MNSNSKWYIKTNSDRKGAFNLLDGSDNVLFHFNPRPSEKSIVISSRINGIWDTSHNLTIPFPSYHPSVNTNIPLHGEIEVDISSGFLINIENLDQKFVYPHVLPWNTFRGNVFMHYQSDQMFESKWTITSNYRRNPSLSQIAVILLCRFPHKVWFDFLEKFRYTVYVVIDDNTVDYKTTEFGKYLNIHILQVEDSVCRNAGYTKSSVTMKKPECAWDKALYFSSCEFMNFTHVWFLEEDVFFYSDQTLMDLDDQFPESDLICNQVTTKAEEPKNHTWKWWGSVLEATGKENYTFYRGMMCACRVSQKVLHEIGEFVKRKKTLFFIEALFPTVTHYLKGTVTFPLELGNIVFQYHWNLTNIVSKRHLYHPVKNIQSHLDFRSYS
jgi:hypothetical protein